MFTNQTLNHEKQRLINLLASYGVGEPILSAFEGTPREEFLPHEYIEEAYEDRALPIGENQTVSQPSLLASILQELKLKGSEKVLEVGTGSGFFAAILGKVVQEVYTIERFDNLAYIATKRLEALKVKNVHIKVGDGTTGWPEYAPFDAIIVSAAFKDVPGPLIEQLKEGGKLVMPLGEQQDQELMLFKKEEDKLQEIKSIAPVRFVQLVGQYGWPDRRH